MIKLPFAFVVVLAVAAICLSSCRPASDAPPATSRVSATELPAAINQFRQSVATMNADEVLAAATARFGPPTRNSGSGISIPQWDIAGGGALTVHPRAGPTFRFADGKTIWLMPTDNPAGESLQNFEMGTLPDLSNHGNWFWMGNVQIAADGTYRFVDSNSNRENRGDQSKNFFIHHPEGHVDIIWPAGINAQSRLEALGDRQIAHLRLISADGTSTFECDVASSAESRSLTIVGPSFKMDAGWPHYWPVRGAK